MKKYKTIIKNIIWKELENLKIGKNVFIEFEWGKKRFKIRRVK